LQRKFIGLNPFSQSHVKLDDCYKSEKGNINLNCLERQIRFPNVMLSLCTKNINRVCYQNIHGLIISEMRSI